MSDVKHTAEPWIVSNLTDVFSADRRGNVNDGFQIADCSVDFDAPDDPGLSIDQRIANARRIVACVNACAGISTEELEEQVSHGRLIALSECSACEQRDNLLGALKTIAGSLEVAGASVPAPENKGTIESSMITGLSIALLLVKQAIEEAEATK
jgi:hypothetical protein